jgi:hypothetical protein
MFKELETEMANLNNEIATVKQHYQVRMQDILKELFDAFLIKYEGVVEYIRWEQYAPAWNDGDACEFSVRELFVKLTLDEDADDEELSDIDNIFLDTKPNYISKEVWDRYCGISLELIVRAPDLQSDINKLKTMFSSIDEEAMQLTFGDPVSVAVHLGDGKSVFNIEYYEGHY